MTAELAKIKNAAIYCRNTDTYGSFEPRYPHNTVAYQVGSAMSFIIDNDLNFCGLYADAADDASSFAKLRKDCLNGKIDVVIVRDLDVLWDNDSILLWLEDFFPVPVIGAEDLDSTRDNLEVVDTLGYKVDERHHSEDHKQALQESANELTKAQQEEGIYTGRTPYGYQRVGDDLIADPETSQVVRKIFDLAIDGNTPTQIRDYLFDAGIKSPAGADMWNLPKIKTTLLDEKYCGRSHIEALINRDDFDRAAVSLNKKKKAEKAMQSVQEPDYFTMAICDICGKKLIYKRDGDLYLCDRHTGRLPKEKPLDHQPRISAQEMRRIVTRQYNEYLYNMKYWQEQSSGFDNLRLDERGTQKIELGEKILHRDGEDIQTICNGYNGIWYDWINDLKKMNTDFYNMLFRKSLPDVWKPMVIFDPRVVKRSVKEIRLRADGTVETVFRAKEAFE